jgi:hypothetical protein
LISYRIEVRMPGSPRWLRFLSFVNEDEAYARAIDLKENRSLYTQVRVIKVVEEILDTFGADYAE